jgi:hypothetical protein
LSTASHSPDSKGSTSFATLQDHNLLVHTLQVDMCSCK